MTITRRVFKTQDPAPVDVPKDDPGEPVDASIETGPADVAPDPEASLEPDSEPAESVPASAGNVPESALAKAVAVLATTDAELSALLSARAEALAADDDARAMELDRAIAAKQQLRTVQLDKVNLRQAEASQAEVREREARHEAKIAGVEALIAERTRLAARLAGYVAVADRTFVKLLSVNRSLATAWAWRPTTHGGAVLLGDRPMLAALRNEIYRVAGRPNPLGGQPDHPDGPGFPGGHPELLQWAQSPEKSSAPMVDKFRLASDAASSIMRVGRVVNAVPEQPDGPLQTSSSAPPGDAAEAPPQSPPVAAVAAGPNVPSISPEIAKLLARQNALAMRDMSEADEREYQENSRLIQEMSA